MVTNIRFQVPTGAFDKAVKAAEQSIRTASNAAIHEVAEDMLSEGQANIVSAGFPSDWSQGLRLKFYPPRSDGIADTALLYHRYSFASVFEFGASIRGSPLLWAPLRSTPRLFSGSAGRAIRATPRAWVQQKGPLFRINRVGGKPLLMGYLSGRGQKGERAVPLFVGLSGIEISKKFNLRQIFERDAARLPQAYQKNLKVD